MHDNNLSLYRVDAGDSKKHKPCLVAITLVECTYLDPHLVGTIVVANVGYLQFKAKLKERNPAAIFNIETVSERWYGS